ncbi:DUF6000 family protein [Aureivirga marina]|uniref:DUF6000 family protein n=1 Tax=Aureivirga marina TaxID=1182451 RepID=UPI0018CB2C96|nr:DUF6000 family protein [Aureivirga marina]
MKKTFFKQFIRKFKKDIDLNDVDTHRKFINPYYLKLMGFNFLRDDNPIKFLESVKSLKDDFTLDDLRTILMFEENWRPRKVGAWVIGLCQIKELEKELIEYLKIYPIYCEHVISNLVLFNSLEGRKAINEHVLGFLEEILFLIKENKFHDGWNLFEINSLRWGFNALKYLDAINKTKDFENMINSNIWKEILIKCNENSSSFSRFYYYDWFKNEENIDCDFTESFKVIKNVVDYE